MRLSTHYRRLGARAWLRVASDYGWGLEGIPEAIRRWRAKHRAAPSPFLLCRTCEDVVLDPVLRRQSVEIREMLDHDPTSFARVPCSQCGGRRKP